MVMPQPQGLTIAREQAAPEKTEATTTTDTSGGTYDENVETVSNQEKALRIATYYRCLNLRANTMAQLTVQYQRLNKDGGNFVQDNYGKAGELNYLLQREPNPLTTAFDMWRQVEIDVVRHGNAFIYIERDDDGWPVWFWLSWLNGYGAAYRAGNCIEPPCACEIEPFLERMPKGCRLTGTATEDGAMPKADAVARIAAKRAGEKQVSPVYLKPSQAERMQS